MLAFITWSVNPEIFAIGPIHLRYYGILFALAFMVDYAIFVRFFKRDSLPLQLLDALTMWAIISTVVGLRLGHCLFYEPVYYLSHPLEMLKVWEGGLASHGAAVGVPLGLYLFCRKYGMRYLWLLDRIVIVVALTGFFIRMGNLINSEIYGMETSLPWGFVFTRRGEVAPKHPTQIYEALAYLCIFFVLYFVYLKKETLRNRSGFLFGVFLMLVFGFRFFVEFIKERQVAFEQGMPLDMGQLLSIPFILVGIGLMVYSFKQEPNAAIFVPGAEKKYRSKLENKKK
ncbi:MAG: prolipoprotein diacylglyceryl transferase [Prevotellaceae bacterium]|jgi:prolipoprotein diacylglyceryl transferase|nr:prolipoprotein diacylglyceryl transferase [Prevotellaceae bacterium]